MRESSLVGRESFSGREGSLGSRNGREVISGHLGESQQEVVSSERDLETVGWKVSSTREGIVDVGKKSSGGRLGIVCVRERTVGVFEL